VTRAFGSLAILLLCAAVASAAETCTHHPFKVGVLRAQVSKSLLSKGVTHAEIYSTAEFQSAKALSFEPKIKRVLVAKADIGRDGQFAFTNLAPGSYWVVLAPLEYRFAVRVRKQALKNVELQIDEENGCIVVDFQFLR
jgi:hypothetical protein